MQKAEMQEAVPEQDPETIPDNDEQLLGGDGGPVFDLADIQARFFEALNWLKVNLLTLDTSVQLAVLAAALVPAALFGPRLKRIIHDFVVPKIPFAILKRAARALAEIATPIALFLILQIARAVISASGLKTGFVEAGISLLTAWIVIRLVTLVIRSAFWSRVAWWRSCGLANCRIGRIWRFGPGAW